MVTFAPNNPSSAAPVLDCIWWPMVNWYKEYPKYWKSHVVEMGIFYLKGILGINIGLFKSFLLIISSIFLLFLVSKEYFQLRFLSSLVF